MKLRQKRVLVNDYLAQRDDHDHNIVSEKDSTNNSLIISKEYYDNNDSSHDSSSDESVIENQFISEIDSSNSEYYSVDELVKTDLSETDSINEDDFKCDDLNANQQCTNVEIMSGVEGICQKAPNHTDQLMNGKKESLADEKVNKIEYKENEAKNDNDRYFETVGQFQSIQLLCSSNNLIEVIENSNKALVSDVDKSNTEIDREYINMELVYKNNDNSINNIQYQNAVSSVDTMIKIKNELLNDSSFEKIKNQDGVDEKRITEKNNSKSSVQDDQIVLSANGLRSLEIMPDIDDEFLITAKTDVNNLDEISIQLPWTTSPLSKDEFLIKKSVK